MKISPFILGSGRAGLAAAKSLAVLGVQEPSLGLLPSRWVPRGSDLKTYVRDQENPMLVISTPHALHAASILEAESAGIRCIVTEKPSCVSLSEAQALEKVRVTVGVLHGYRQMWGVKKLKEMIDEGALGSIIAIEGRYWQSSAAERALLEPAEKVVKGWKDDVSLSGTADALLDIGTHWIDAVSFLLGQWPTEYLGMRSYLNSESPHRDTHVQLFLKYPSGQRAMGSISKTLHGATNFFELVVIGTLKSAQWNFLEPDQILEGEGRDLRVHRRKSAELGSRQAAFHGMGWLEGYIETFHQVIQEAFLGRSGNYPKLCENIQMMKTLFSSNLWKAGPTET